jgi:hypothetical protein
MKFVLSKLKVSLLALYQLFKLVQMQGKRGFLSMERYYHRSLLFIIYLTATCFRRMTILKIKYIY